MTFNGTSMCINGNPTLGENLVDLGGIELAFRALQQNFADRGASPRLVQELSGNHWSNCSSSHLTRASVGA
jgi:hypothetical protein